VFRGDAVAHHSSGCSPPMSVGGEEAQIVELLPLQPLPAVLGILALGSFAAALVPGSRSARCVRRGLALSVVAVYAWVVV
jgi:hypothetical protein